MLKHGGQLLFFRRTRNLVGLCCFGFLLVYWPDQAAGGTTPPTGDIHKSPVYFEMFDQFVRAQHIQENFTLLPSGKILIPPFRVKDLGDFSWATGRSLDRSWALRLQDFKYLLPFIKSAKAEHRLFARDWVNNWDEAHRNHQKPSNAAWEAMTSAIRAMVLVYFLKKEELREPKDEVFIALLRRSVKEHQQFLAEGSRFDIDSNHGMWEAVALAELTRVFPSSKFRKTALRRFVGLVGRSVSLQGIHLEHSPGYHYVFLKWLLDNTAYLQSLRGKTDLNLARMEAIGRKMLVASYFLQDHQGRKPVIGDTNEGEVEKRFRVQSTLDEDGVLFDRTAGYAIYKGNQIAGDRRYVVFNIQNKVPDLPYHFHNDALALYFNYDGEVILGDQGKYSYTWSEDRKYFVSLSAHNVVVPQVFLEPEAGMGFKIGKLGILLVKNPWVETSREQTVFGAKVTHRYRLDPAVSIRLLGPGVGKKMSPDRDVAGVDSSKAVEIKTIERLELSFWRRVRIPTDSSQLIVEDSISGGSPMVLIWNIGSDVEQLEREGAGDKPNQKVYAWQLVTRRGNRFRMTIQVQGGTVADRAEVLVMKGQTEPPFGWYSPSYLEKQPSPVILYLLDEASDLIVTTKVEKIR